MYIELISVIVDDELQSRLYLVCCYLSFRIYLLYSSPEKYVVWLHVLLDSGDGLLIDLDADLMLIEELVGLGGCAAVATVVGAGGNRGRGYSVPVTRQWRPPRRSRMLAHRSYIYINPGTHAIIIYTRKINVYIYNWHYIAYNNNNNSTAERENRRERKNVNDLDFPSGPRYIIPRRAMKAISVKHFDAFSWFLFFLLFSLYFSFFYMLIFLLLDFLYNNIEGVYT